MGVCGGEILNDDNLASFKSPLLLLYDKRERERLKGRTVAETFFFHGHVIALHGMTGSNGNTCWTRVQRQSWLLAMVEPPQPSFSNSEERERQLMDYDDELPMNVVRVLCTDVENSETFR